MIRRLNAHPLATWTSIAAVAAGVGVSVDLSTGVPAAGPPDPAAPGFVDAVVIEVEQQTIDLHIPPESPIWTVAPTLCGAAAGVLRLLGYGPPNCQIGYQPPPIERVLGTLYVSGSQVRLDFSGQSMVGVIESDGSFGSWAVLDPATGQSIPWTMGAGGGPGFAAMGASVELTNLIAPMGGIRTASTGPLAGPTGESRAGHTVSGYAYGYTVSGGVTLPDGTESGIAIEVQGMARYADQGPFFNDGGIITVIDQLAGDMLFQHMEPPPALDPLRDMGGLLSVDEVLRIHAYRAVVAPGDVGGAAMELVRAQAHTRILDARRETVPASLFGAGAAGASCDCSCDAYDAFMSFVDLPPAQRDQDPRALAMVACGQQCVNRWAIRCHQ